MKQVAITAAKEAGKILMKHFRKSLKVSYKTKHHIVTNIDLMAEKKIISIINKHYPDHAILSEEEGSVKKLSPYTWIIDPIDGTHNYLYGFPLFGVSIALEYRGKVVLGVIYLPYLDDLYVAERGKGAFLNGKRIKVSKRKALKESFIFYDSNLYSQTAKRLRVLKKISLSCFSTRINGVAVFSFVCVASGIGDGHVALNTNPWDIAAGMLIIEEAGGRCTDMKGKPWSPYIKHFVCSNGKIHKSLLNAIK